MKKTMKGMTIRESIEKVTNIKQGKEEDYQDYLNRLGDEAERKMSQKQFERLPEGAQDWLSQAAADFDEGKPVADFPDKVVETTQDKTEEQPVKKKKVMSESKKECNEKPTSLSVKVIKLIGEHPDWELDQVKQELTTRKISFKDITVNTVYYDVRRILKTLGYISV